MSANVLKHMVDAGEIADTDVTNVKEAVYKLVHSKIPPSPVMEQKVANYRYHFAERDQFLAKFIKDAGDAVKDNVTDG